MFQHEGMRRVDPELLRETILTAPGWARVGLTAPRQQTREAAATELVQVIVRAIDGEDVSQDTRQIALPL